MAAIIGLIIGVLLLVIRLYARSQVNEGMADPFVAWSVGVVDRGKEYKVYVDQMKIVSNEDELVKQYLQLNPQAHHYFVNGDPRYSNDPKYRYAANITVNGVEKPIVSHPYPNNEAGMQLNLQGKKSAEVYVAPNGDVNFLFW